MQKKKKIINANNETLGSLYLRMDYNILDELQLHHNRDDWIIKVLVARVEMHNITMPKLSPNK